MSARAIGDTQLMYPRPVSISSTPTMLIVRAAACGVAQPHGRAEEHLIGRVVVARRRRVDDFGKVETVDQEANAPVDLPQPLLAVDVVAVLGAIAVAGGPRDRRDKLGPLARERSSSSLRRRAKPPGVM
jgi:hypothetical protein